MTSQKTIVPFAILAVLAAACGGSPSATTAVSTPTPRRSAPPTSLASAGPIVTGFGATEAAWNSNHTADSKYAPGAVYDPDPNVRSGDRYDATMHTDGHVLGYTMNLPAGTTVDAAKAAVLREFPSDASIIWFVARDSCALLEVKSALLGSALGDPKIGDAEGMALIELDTVHPDGTSSYDPRNINEGLFGLGSFATSGDAPAC